MSHLTPIYYSVPLIKVTVVVQPQTLESCGIIQSAMEMVFYERLFHQILSLCNQWKTNSNT